MVMSSEPIWKATYRILGENAGPNWAQDCADWAWNQVHTADNAAIYIEDGPRDIFLFNTSAFRDALTANMFPTDDPLIGATQFAESWKTAMLASISLDIRVGDRIIDDPFFTNPNDLPEIDYVEYAYIHDITVWDDPGWSPYIDPESGTPDSKPSNGYDKLLELQFSPIAYTYEEAWLPVKLNEAFRRLKFQIKGNSNDLATSGGSGTFYYKYLSLF